MDALSFIDNLKQSLVASHTSEAPLPLSELPETLDPFADDSSSDNECQPKPSCSRKCASDQSEDHKSDGANDTHSKKRQIPDTLSLEYSDDEIQSQSDAVFNEASDALTVDASHSRAKNDGFAGVSLTLSMPSAILPDTCPSQQWSDAPMAALRSAVSCADSIENRDPNRAESERALSGHSKSCSSGECTPQRSASDSRVTHKPKSDAFGIDETDLDQTEDGKMEGNSTTVTHTPSKMADIPTKSALDTMGSDVEMSGHRHASESSTAERVEVADAIDAEAMVAEKSPEFTQEQLMDDEMALAMFVTKERKLKALESAKMSAKKQKRRRERRKRAEVVTTVTSENGALKSGSNVQMAGSLEADGEAESGEESAQLSESDSEDNARLRAEMEADMAEDNDEPQRNEAMVSLLERMRKGTLHSGFGKEKVATSPRKKHLNLSEKMEMISPMKKRKQSKKWKSSANTKAAVVATVSVEESATDKAPKKLEFEIATLEFEPIVKGRDLQLPGYVSLSQTQPMATLALDSSTQDTVDSAAVRSGKRVVGVSELGMSLIAKGKAQKTKVKATAQALTFELSAAHLPKSKHSLEQLRRSILASKQKKAACKKQSALNGRTVMDSSERELMQIAALHNVAGVSRRKAMMHKLHAKVSKTRKKLQRKHRREFGTEEQYIDTKETAVVMTSKPSSLLTRMKKKRRGEKVLSDFSDSDADEVVAAKSQTQMEGEQVDSAEPKHKQKNATEAAVIDVSQSGDKPVVNGNTAESSKAKSETEKRKLEEEVNAAFDGDLDEETIDSDVEEVDSKLIAKATANVHALDDEEKMRLRYMAPEQFDLVPEHVRKFFDIEAVDEDEEEAGVKPQDEYEAKFGVAKNLLADGSELFAPNEDEMRHKLFRKMQAMDEEFDTELMEKAFVEGKYKELQKMYGKNKEELGEELDGAEKVMFESRDRQWAKKADDYLSENEEKNNACVYDSNGFFLPVDQIRFNLYMWNREKDQAKADYTDSDSDAEENRERNRRLMKKAIAKRVAVESQSMDAFESKAPTASLEMDEELEAEYYAEKVAARRMRHATSVRDVTASNSANANASTSSLSKAVTSVGASLLPAHLQQSLSYLALARPSLKKAATLSSTSLLRQQSDDATKGSRTMPAATKKKKKDTTIASKQKTTDQNGDVSSTDFGAFYRKIGSEIPEQKAGLSRAKTATTTTALSATLGSMSMSGFGSTNSLLCLPQSQSGFSFLGDHGGADSLRSKLGIEDDSSKSGLGFGTGFRATDDATKASLGSKRRGFIFERAKTTVKPKVVSKKTTIPKATTRKRKRAECGPSALESMYGNSGADRKRRKVS